MKYYPINLNIQKKQCLVVGGGAVGLRKVSTLLECGGYVKVVSPKLIDPLNELLKNNKIVWINREYQFSDLEKIFLVIGATDKDELNWKISKDANSLNILCNIVDKPEACNFILPSIVNRGDLIIAISTSGNSPAFARSLREKLEKEFGDEYEEFLHLMGIIRKKLLSKNNTSDDNKLIFEKLIKSDLLSFIKMKNTEKIDMLLKEIIGDI